MLPFALSLVGARHCRALVGRLSSKVVKANPIGGLMKAIEVMATVDEQGQLSLDIPLTVDQHTRVRVIVLLPKKADKENNQEKGA